MDCNQKMSEEEIAQNKLIDSQLKINMEKSQIEVAQKNLEETRSALEKDIMRMNETEKFVETKKENLIKTEIDQKQTEKILKAQVEQIKNQIDQEVKAKENISEQKNVLHEEREIIEKSMGVGNQKEVTVNTKKQVTDDSGTHTSKTKNTYFE